MQSSGDDFIGGETIWFDNVSLSVESAAVPEPATLGLLILAAGIFGIRRSR